ncbi:hypothetical protein EV698_0230 [Spiribacter vilamensis]|uniref:Uncharacterized protein n=1 Tax=Spiribacter vilamensis TaxID=531306 RepID=A0A4Q8CYG3_9GAMM|nr:hypothetical protein EV698_0230 [Spiribacter vilamensis]
MKSQLKSYKSLSDVPRISVIRSDSLPSRGRQQAMQR